MLLWPSGVVSVIRIFHSWSVGFVGDFQWLKITAEAVPMIKTKFAFRVGGFCFISPKTQMRRGLSRNSSTLFQNGSTMGNSHMTCKNVMLYKCWCFIIKRVFKIVNYCVGYSIWLKLFNYVMCNLKIFPEISFLLLFVLLHKLSKLQEFPFFIKIIYCMYALLSSSFPKYFLLPYLHLCTEVKVKH